MGFFYRQKPKGFNYIPRYYDPDKEAWEKKKAAQGMESNLSHEEQLRMQMRSKWGSKDEETPSDKRSRLLRLLVLGGIIVFLFYFIFCTPIITNVVSGLMAK